MSGFSIFSTRRARIRKATRALSKDSCTANYVALAKEFVATGLSKRAVQSEGGEFRIQLRPGQGVELRVVHRP